MDWRRLDVRGDAGVFHAAEVTAERSVTFVTVDRPTLVLGSAQPDDDVDRRVADALGIEVVRRRSGGGAVLLWPGEFVWADVVIPAGDPLWSADVAQAMVWVGEWWAKALGSGGVHRGPLVSNEWSRRVCWSSTGTGEVLDATGGKLVGISQRRTREVARFQTMCHLSVRPELVAALVSPPRPTAADLAPSFARADVDPPALVAALVRHLPR